MKTITKAAFSRECGVSKAAIDGAIKRGSVITTNDGKVNLDHRITREYKSKQKNKKKKDIVEKTKPIKKKIVAAVTDPDEELPTGEQMDLPLSDINSIDRNDLLKYEKKDIEKLKLYEQTKLENIKVAEKEGTLISRDLVKQVFSKIYTVDTEQLRSMEERISPMICGVCGVQDDSLEGVKVREIINKEVAKALEHIKRIIDSHLVAVGSVKL